MCIRDSIYTAAHEAVTGKPLMRAMFLDDPNPYTLGKATAVSYTHLIAKTMLADGVDINLIMKYSGLTQEQIDKLK